MCHHVSQSDEMGLHSSGVNYMRLHIWWVSQMGSMHLRASRIRDGTLE